MSRRWDPDQLSEFKPFVLLMVGNRRQGKSYLCNHLCRRLMMRNEFDLVLSFMGSAHCNPQLHAFLGANGFGDFQFNKWDSDLMARLEAQQLELMRQGRERHVLILVDDITMDHCEKEKLAHLCVRGRHFYVSVMMLSVSYSNFHKSCRRSCDIIVLFSMGCQSDRELMMKEFAHKQHQCEFFMSQIVQREHTAAVLNLNEKRQQVYWYKANDARTTEAPYTVGPGRRSPGSSTARSADDGGGDGRMDPCLAPAKTDPPEDRPDPVSSDVFRSGDA